MSWKSRLVVHMYVYMCLEGFMPQLHLYVPEAVAASIRRRAKAIGQTVSGYLAQLVTREVQDGWPVRFFDDVVGGWKGDPLERPSQGRYEEREGF